VIRPARVADVPALREIERAAGETFREIGLDVVADEEPPPAAVLAAPVTPSPAEPRDAAFQSWVWPAPTVADLESSTASRS